MSDVLCIMGEINKRFYDVMTEKVDNRSAEQIIADVLTKADLRIE